MVKNAYGMLVFIGWGIKEYHNTKITAAQQLLPHTQLTVDVKLTDLSRTVAELSNLVKNQLVKSTSHSTGNGSIPDDEMDASWPMSELPAQCMSGPLEPTACQTFLQYGETPCQCTLAAAQHKDYTAPSIHKSSQHLSHYDMPISKTMAGHPQQVTEAMGNEQDWIRARVGQPAASHGGEAKSDISLHPETSSRKRKRPVTEDSQTAQLVECGSHHVNSQGTLAQEVGGSGIGKQSGIQEGSTVRSRSGVSAGTGSGEEPGRWPTTADPEDVRRDIQSGFGQIHTDLIVLQHFIQSGCEHLIEQASSLINLLMTLLQQFTPCTLHNTSSTSSSSSLRAQS
ncbi:uncharacterized protein LOC122553149 [Chiloscyllium plagiosum]|uniref:uncharacterized protein LOC122553149 n=1 Tax=Chiloscyllium plagiosum TaxID=36176 RepID=UPI001CB878C0|nr:uncharacterized protein LOC122553149 [Chiloscyllium plagiosum]